MEEMQLVLIVCLQKRKRLKLVKSNKKVSFYFYIQNLNIFFLFIKRLKILIVRLYFFI